MFQMGRSILAVALGHGRRGPVRVMALLLLATGIGVQISVWTRMPLWFHLSFLALIVLICLVGGRYGRRP